MKKIKNIIAGLIICLCIDQTASAQTSTSFSGTWQRNDQESNAGGLSINSIPLKLEITEDKTTLTVKGTNKNAQGEVSLFTDVLKSNGTQTERKAGTDLMKYMVPKWSADRKTLTETATYKDQESNIKQTIVSTFVLSPDGRQLTVSCEQTLGERTFKLTEVYDKH